MPASGSDPLSTDARNGTGAAQPLQPGTSLAATPSNEYRGGSPHSRGRGGRHLRDLCPFPGEYLAVCDPLSERVEDAGVPTPKTFAALPLRDLIAASVELMTCANRFDRLDVKAVRTQRAELTTKHLRNSLQVFLHLVKFSRALDRKAVAELIAARDYEELDWLILGHLMAKAWNLSEYLVVSGFVPAYMLDKEVVLSEAAQNRIVSSV